MKTKTNKITGEKWFHLKLVLQVLQNLFEDRNKPAFDVGEDNGFRDGYKYWRGYELYISSDDKVYIVETKSTVHMANFSRTFQVLGWKSSRPQFYLVENWNH